MVTTAPPNPKPSDTADASHEVVAWLRAAQAAWARTTLRERLRVLRRFRALLAERGETTAQQITEALPTRDHPAETLSAEVIPLADAARFLEREALRLLQPRRVGLRGRPWWLMGVRSRVRRVPWGVVLIIAPSNYPLMLLGVQALSALVAGNAVWLKPGRDGAAAAHALRDLLHDAGLPRGLLHVTDESVEAATDAIDAGVDHIVLTGSAATGRKVLAQAAESLTPVTCELSGCDAMIVLRDADLDLVEKAVVFGMRLNRSATCIAPRRIIAERPIAAELERRLSEAFAAMDPPPRLIADGSMLDEDVFEPVTCLVAADDADNAARLANASRYALGASVFGSEPAAQALASRLRAGSICLNDLIMPTADPRLPFGGTGESGFGVTRGPEGLLAMTRPIAIATHAGTFRPHYDPPCDADVALFTDYLRAAHAPTLGQRVRGWGALLKSLSRRGTDR